MQRSTILVLKVLIGALIALLVTCQIFVIPAVAAQSAWRYHEIAYLQVPGIIVGILFLICVQVVLVCVWRLLSLVRRDAIFSERAFPDVDVSLGAVGFATFLVAVTLVTFMVTGVENASITLLCVLGLVVGGGLSLLIVVLRGLLKKAWQLEQDLSEVV
ncbi:DUF2975 domain-containing protein [Microbacterium sp. SLBN-146]|uniref:DUF2975 domain-containing protein n=1 Tax=Microbacterium sp. SLBN-146 TaxID=2768457 RepID=UPI00114E4364|nr:DUF2975 domain-containing protein [Microbacterium sp. SLBN-146]TQJ29819.1 DUF2975 family protein [Microbacterium sp. SLBN-146]